MGGEGEGRGVGGGVLPLSVTPNLFGCVPRVAVGTAFGINFPSAMPTKPFLRTWCTPRCRPLVSCGLESGGS